MEQKTWVLSVFYSKYIPSASIQRVARSSKDKTHYMQFVNKNCSPFDLNFGHGNKKITNTCTTKFLGITLESTLSWKTHIDTTVPKLSSATFAIRTVKPYLSQDSLKMIYYSYFQCIMTYGIILGGNSHYSNTIFRLPKKNY